MTPCSLATPTARPAVAQTCIVIAAAILALGALTPERVQAQSDHRTTIRVLQSGRDFRARVRAAFALGSSSDPSVAPHLIGALRDDNPAVRAAAATALGRLGQPSAIAPLRRLRSDRVRAVRHEAERAIQRIEASRPPPRRASTRHARRRSSRSPYPSISVLPRSRDIHWPRVRYVVVLGTMQNRSNFRDTTLESQLMREVSRSLTVLRGVAVIPAGRMPAEAEREIRRRRLPRLRLEGTLTRVERRTHRRQLSVRCEVSLMLMEEPGRNIRSVLNGAATGQSPRRGNRRTQERGLAQQALEGAVRSAMSGAATAISSAGRR